jgi:hypothetical protein
MAEIKYLKPIVNSLGGALQDKRWCLKFAVEDAKLAKLKPGSKEFKDFVKKRADELFQIHGVEAEGK